MSKCPICNKETTIGIYENYSVEECGGYNCVSKYSNYFVIALDLRYLSSLAFKNIKVGDRIEFYYYCDKYLTEQEFKKYLNLKGFF